MKSMREHLMAEEVAAYANRSLDIGAERQVDKHVASCDRCLGVLINALWDRLERRAGCAARDRVRAAREDVLLFQHQT